MPEDKKNDMPIPGLALAHKMVEIYPLILADVHEANIEFVKQKTASASDFFSLDQSGNLTGGDFRKVYSGNSTLLDNFAAGTAFIVIRRSDSKGLQLSSPGDHAMIATVGYLPSGLVR